MDANVGFPVPMSSLDIEEHILERKDLDVDFVAIDLSDPIIWINMSSAT